MDLDKYLARIGYTGSIAPTLDTLQEIHRRHLLSVPFENLTIHSGGRVSLELPHLYEKVVHQRRGGFCYEINGLFSWLLGQLGFQVTVLYGQVKNPITGQFGPPYDHFINMVTIDQQRWLCDVGFGVGFRVPLSLETDLPQEQENGTFRVRALDETLFLESMEDDDDGWRPLYKFTLQPRRQKDFTEMCIYHQTSNSSLFVCKSLCSLHLPKGRITYMGRKLTVTSFSSGGPGTKTVLELTDEMIPSVLKEKFGIELTLPLIPKDVDIIPPPPIY